MTIIHTFLMMRPCYTFGVKNGKVGITGSRIVTPQMEMDVRQAVANIYTNENMQGALLDDTTGIVVGGAPGVDHIALNEALRHDPTARTILVIIPTSLADYKIGYKLRIDQGKATRAETEIVMQQLDGLVRINPKALLELPMSQLTREAFESRNNQIIAHSFSLLAFQLNSSSGTGYTISKACESGIPVIVKTYT